MVETIVAALIGGLTAVPGVVGKKAVEDAYTALKDLILRKLGAQSEAAGAITKLEAKPDSKGGKVTLEEELEAAKAGEDAALVEAARRLQAALDALSLGERTHVQHATGSNIAQADRGSTATISVKH